jgi:putative transposase
MDTHQNNDTFSIPDELWAKIEPLLPARRPRKRADRPGRPRQSDRQMMTAIFYLLRTGCQWKALPHDLGASSTVHDRFQQWCAAGTFAALWRAGLLEYDRAKGLDWEWQAMDGAMTKAPLGGKRYGSQSHGSR